MSNNKDNNIKLHGIITTFFNDVKAKFKNYYTSTETDNKITEEIGKIPAPETAKFGDGSATTTQSAPANSKTEQKAIDDAQDLRIKAAEDEFVKKADVLQDGTGLSDTNKKIHVVRFDPTTNKMSVWEKETKEYHLHLSSPSGNHTMGNTSAETIIGMEISWGRSGTGTSAPFGYESSLNNWIYGTLNGSNRGAFNWTGTSFNFTSTSSDNQIIQVSFKVRTEKWSKKYDLNGKVGDV